MVARPTFCGLSEFFCAKVRGEVGKVVLYEDEATPGNKLHWHNPREMLCWYWTLAQFPAWYRSRKHGWFVLGYIKTPILKKLVGGASGMAKQILHFFWSSTNHNFDKGIFLSYDDVEFKFRARLHCIIVDGLAEKKLCSLKGASGMKCCADCKNVLTGPPHKYYKNHPYLINTHIYVRRPEVTAPPPHMMVWSCTRSRFNAPNHQVTKSAEVQQVQPTCISS